MEKEKDTTAMEMCFMVCLRMAYQSKDVLYTIRELSQSKENSKMVCFRGGAREEASQDR